jgi:hypothetical protein
MLGDVLSNGVSHREDKPGMSPLSKKELRRLVVAYERGLGRKVTEEEALALAKWAMDVRSMCERIDSVAHGKSEATIQMVNGGYSIILKQ